MHDGGKRRGYVDLLGLLGHIAITIIAELMMAYKADGCRHFQYGYKYFRGKFNYTRDQVRCAIVRLEQKKLLERQYKTIKLNGRWFNNEIFLIFYPEHLKTLATEFDGTNNKNFQILQEIRNNKINGK